MSSAVGKAAMPGLLYPGDNLMLRRLGFGIFAIFALLIIGCGAADVPPQEPTPALETPAAEATLPPLDQPTEVAPGQPLPPTDPDAAGARDGDTVRVHYTGRLQDGTVFDSSEGQEPLQFTLGQGQLIPGFEQGVLGLEAGESTTLNIPAEEAYGPHRPDLVVDMPRDTVPPDMELEVGMVVQVSGPDGGVTEATVVELTDTTVTLDANHFLAGQDLIFDIEVVEVN
jgi:peptidylprolyl isomerase